MEKELSESIQTEIKEIIEIILHEIELQDIGAIRGMSFVEISSKKFRYPRDLGRIIEKINGEETPRVLRIVSENDINKIESPFKLTAKNLVKLQRVRSMFDFGFGLEQVESFYFLIENLERLKEIKTKIDETLGVEKIILQISEERKEIMRKNDNRFKHSFRKTLGINKRFGYLVKICKNPKISGYELCGSATLQNLSKEIKKINYVVKNKLKLLDELIINEGHSGYEINNKYKIEFIL